MKIWLDDIREPYPHLGPDIYWVKRASGAIALLEARGDVECVDLDHDLGDDEGAGTGYDVLAWIEQRVHGDDGYCPPLMHVHTANPVARERMFAAIKSIWEYMEKP